MKIVFLLDNREYVETEPEKLQIRQLQPGAAVLGMEVAVPASKEDGTPDLNEDGTPKTQAGFRPLVNYSVDLLPAFADAEEEIEHLSKLLAEKISRARAAAQAAPLALAALTAAGEPTAGGPTAGGPTAGGPTAAEEPKTPKNRKASAKRKAN